VEIWVLVLIPVASAAIGYLTNVVAVKMLFHPQKPMNILGFKVQGLIPRRKNEMASAIADTIQQEFVSGEDIEVVIRDAFKRRGLDEIITQTLQERTEKVRERVSFRTPVQRVAGRLLPSLVKSIPQWITRQMVRSVIPPEETVQKVASEARKFDIKDYTIQKIAEYEEGRLEGILHRLGSQELRLIETYGGILGFLVGMVQVIILTVLS
jgi:uncharacterized membrane protein YheB (UPF0754 family)